MDKHMPREKAASILRHMLGTTDLYKREFEPYRNYYASQPGDADIAALAGEGLVRLYSAAHTRVDGVSTYDYHEATEAGIALARESFYRLREKKSRRVYRAFLRLRDAWPDLTFRMFITGREFRETRERC